MHGAHLLGMRSALTRCLIHPDMPADNDSVQGLVFIWIIASPFVAAGCLKGRYTLSIVGLFVLFGIPAILAGTRLARQDSWWAKRFYDEEQLARAARRYPGRSQINDAFTL
jgi:hypothetical protein